MRLATLTRAIEEPLFELDHRSRTNKKLSLKIVRGAQLRSGGERRNAADGPTLVAEQRSEDPLIVTLDAVVGKH